MVDGDVLGLFEAVGALTAGAELVDDAALGVVDADAVLPDVGDDPLALVGDGKPAGMLEHGHKPAFSPGGNARTFAMDVYELYTLIFGIGADD